MILVGDVLEQLATLDSESVQCCVTSPPYWGLRDYGTGTWEGGDESCDHKGMPLASSSSSLAGYSSENVKVRTNSVPFRDTCGKCGAVRIDRQIGLEKSPGEFIDKLVAVFREVRRVLRRDGIAWCNIGDSYAAQRGGTCMPAETLAGGVGGKSEYADPLRGRQRHGGYQAHRNASSVGLKHKDMCLIPERLIIALQEDGWYVRDKICWAKKSPMPESCTDRCTKSWEPIFMLTKSARYYFDQEAVREQAEYGFSTEIGAKIWNRSGVPSEVENRPDGSTTIPGNGGTRNMRNVWHLGPDPFPEAHFATFVQEIPRRAILCATSERGCCAKCGAPWRRKTNKTKLRRERPNELTKRNGAEGTGNHCANTVAGVAVETLGWEPGCQCNAKNLVCTKCCTVIESWHDNIKSGTKHRVSSLRKTSPPASSRQTEEVLLPAVLLQGRAEAGGSEVRKLQARVSSQELPREILQQDMCNEMDSTTQKIMERQIRHDKGICDDLRARTSASCDIRLCDGAQIGDGKDDRTASEEKRSCSSYQWPEGGQSPGELTVNDKEASRQNEATEVQSHVPQLRESLSVPRECNFCGSQSLKIVDAISPCIVLDCFCGSGTTGRVARLLGRDFIGIELNPAYAKMAERRIAAPLEKVPTIEPARGQMELFA